jgi:hypothetical protein
MPTLLLHDLLPELLPHILQYLHVVDIECLARTFNWRLYAACIPKLKNRLAFQRHARRMLDLFGYYVPGRVSLDCSPVLLDLSLMGGLLAPKYAELPVSCSLSDPVTHADPTRNIEFLELNGDLYWLQAPRPHTGFRGGTLPRDYTFEITALLEQAATLGLSVPPSFVQFFTDFELRDRMPGFIGEHDDVVPHRTLFAFEPLETLKLRHAASVGGLAPYDASVHGYPAYETDAHGYVIRFLMNLHNRRRNHWFLYLDTTGAHCVLGTPVGMRPGEERSRSMNAGDVRLWGYSFEHFLANLYFGRWHEGLIHREQVCDDYGRSPAYKQGDSPLPPHVEAFFTTLYTEDGRASWRTRPLMRDVYHDEGLF